MNIVIISGSPRQQSVTHRIALHLEQQIKTTTEHQVSVVDVRDWNLGFLQQVFQNVASTPEPFKPLAEQMFAADGFILVTPEYNGSYAPALQNLLDHFPKQLHKPFGIVTGSTGGFGGIRASQDLFLLIAGLFGIASPQKLLVPFMDKKFDAEGNLIDEAFAASVHTFLKSYLWLAERLVHEHANA